MKLIDIDENTLGCDYVVGDIHGSYTLLMKKLNEVKFNFKTDRLFSVGDLVNKGNQSVSVLHLLDLSWFYPVLGNHELMIIENYRHGWYSKHLYKYNGFWFLQLNPYAKEIVIDMFESLPVGIELKIGNKKIGIVHAEVPDNNWITFKDTINSPTEKAYKSMTEAVWSRNKIDYLDRTEVAGIDAVFVGHTILREISRLGNTYYIDTGAFVSDNITVFNLTKFFNS